MHSLILVLINILCFSIGFFLGMYTYNKEVIEAVEVYRKYTLIDCNTITTKELFYINKDIQNNIVLNKLIEIELCKR